MKKTLMLAMAVALLLGACATTHADSVVARNGNNAVRLIDQPCSNEGVLKKLAPAMRARMRDADALVEGNRYHACWIVEGNSAHLLYDDGDQGLIPLADFHPELGV
jgi:hypothetical protein